MYAMSSVAFLAACLCTVVLSQQLGVKNDHEVMIINELLGHWAAYAVLQYANPRRVSQTSDSEAHDDG